jgi:hypothetical protein
MGHDNSTRDDRHARREVRTEAFAAKRRRQAGTQRSEPRLQDQTNRVAIPSRSWLQLNLDALETAFTEQSKSEQTPTEVLSRTAPPSAAACVREVRADTRNAMHHEPPGSKGKRRPNEPRQSDLRSLIEHALDGARFSGIEVEDERTILASYRTLAGHLKCSKSTVHECLSRMSGWQVATFARCDRRTRITLLRRSGEFPAYVPGFKLCWP